MLTYAFDLLTLIYEEEGYAPTEIPALILRHNLHGLEICPRAAQLAELALVFKAREKSRRFFQPEHLVRPHIIELRNVRFAENELRDYIHALGLGDLFNQPMLRLLHQFEEAKNFGSLIQPCLDERAIADVRRAIEAKDLGGQLFLRETHLKVLRVLEQAEALTQRYHVVVANPPYMGGKQMNVELKHFAKDCYADSKSDLFAMFMERGFSLAVQNGWSAMVTMQSWMFLSSYEALRLKTLRGKTVHAMVHMGNMVMGIAFGTTATICENRYRVGHMGQFSFVDSEDLSVENEPTTFPIRNNRLKSACADDFAAIPGSPIAYWASDAVKTAFRAENERTLGEMFTIVCGLFTCDNGRFIRKWWEIEKRTSNIHRPKVRDEYPKWITHVKGGAGKRWSAAIEDVVNYGKDGAQIRDFRISRGQSRSLPGEEYYFRQGVALPLISSSAFSPRAFEMGSTFDISANSAFECSHPTDMLLAFLSSKVGLHLMEYVCPTLNFTPGDIAKLPFLAGKLEVVSRELKSIARECIVVSREDENNFETSWDFRDQPLLRPGLKGATLEASWRNWEAQSTAAIRRMQELETENNRLFITAYGLDGELQPSVPEAQITLARAEARRDMAAFLSYAVGCMMGRYSPDHPGLILANAGDSLREFLEKVGKPLAELTFAPDEDGIIPVLDGEWFEDDIVARTRDFLRATFGEATLRENLRFLEDSLGNDLRKYFLTDFYKDHLQTYKKRPIYWLVSSGKQRAFQCLVYLHRYHEGTLARMRAEYVIPLQGRIASRIEQLDGDKLKATSTSHRNKLQREQDDLKKQQAELLTFEEKLKHAADQKISLDLDDGVKVNYAKFGDLLAESKSICGTKEED